MKPSSPAGPKPHRAAPSKKSAILEMARHLAAPRFTAAEIEQIRRHLIAELGEQGKTSPDYIVSVLEEAGLKVAGGRTVTRIDERYEEEFRDLLHFSTLEEAEMSLVRLDELVRKFEAAGERAAAERVRETGRLGKRRSEMIARNTKVEENKRAEKQEIATWFTIWLQTPKAFFDWLEVRKRSPEFVRKFPPVKEAE